MHDTYVSRPGRISGEVLRGSITPEGATWWSAECCEHTSILRALIKYPQGNLEEIQQKTLQSTQEEPGGRQDRKARTYAAECYAASHVPLVRTQAGQYVRWFR
jgi:hypothetical protein